MTSNNTQSGRGFHVPYHLDDESQQNGDVEESVSRLLALTRARVASRIATLLETIRLDLNMDADDLMMGHHLDFDPSDPSHIPELNLNSLRDGPSDRDISMTDACVPNPPHVRRP